MTGWRSVTAAGALLTLTLGCAATPAPSPVAPAPAMDVPDLEERALLLLMADQQLYDPYTVTRARERGPGLRLELARTLGRTGDARARPVLEALLIDAEVEVRREAAFQLGVLGDAEGLRSLGQAARDVDRETGRLAVASMARLGATVPAVRQVLDGLPPEEYWGRLAPSLFRFPAEPALPVVRRALIEGGTASYEDAVYALTRNPLPESLPILRELLAEPNAELRGLAARALGRVGDRSDLEALLSLLADEDAGVVVQALRSARRLVSSGASAPPPAWREPLAGLIDDPRTGVRLTAVETAGAWLRDEPLGERLAARFAAASGRERELALLALAASRHPRAREYVGRASASDDRSLRRRAPESRR